MEVLVSTRVFVCIVVGVGGMSDGVVGGMIFNRFLVSGGQLVKSVKHKFRYSGI